MEFLHSLSALAAAVRAAEPSEQGDSRVWEDTGDT